MNFKEAKITIITILVLTVLFAGASLSFAAEKTETLTIADFQVDEPAILPGNPFYKLKGFFKSIFSAQDTTQELNTSAAELLKVEEVTSLRSKMFYNALKNYKTAIETVSPISEHIKNSDELIETLKLHIRFTTELLSRATEEKTIKTIEAIQKELHSEYDEAAE